MLFDTYCFQNLLLTWGKVHIEENVYFQNVDLHLFCTVFSTICGTVVEENEKTLRGSKLSFRDPCSILRCEEVEISVRDTCRNQVLPRVFWCRQCLWRVPRSQMKC